MKESGRSPALLLAIVAGAMAVGGGLLALRGCGADPEEELLALPRRLARLMRERDWDEVFAHVAEEFEARGIDRRRLRVLLPRIVAETVGEPLVAWAGGPPEEVGLEERSLVVLGMFCRGSLSHAAPETLRPFRVEARLRREGGAWLITAATLHR